MGCCLSSRCCHCRCQGKVEVFAHTGLIPSPPFYEGHFIFCDEPYATYPVVTFGKWMCHVTRLINNLINNLIDSVFACVLFL